MWENEKGKGIGVQAGVKEKGKGKCGEVRLSEGEYHDVDEAQLETEDGLNEARGEMEEGHVDEAHGETVDDISRTGHSLQRDPIFRSIYKRLRTSYESYLATEPCLALTREPC